VLTCHAGFCDTTDCTPGWGNCTQPVGVAPDDGCETNLNTSLSNCGDCGTACKALAPSTATCTAGRCLVTLASGQNAPLDIVADGLDVYWTNDSSMNPGGTTTPGSVLMIPVGGGSPSTLASGQESPAGLAVEGSVYWADRLDGTVLKVDLASAGSPTTLASGQNSPQGLAIHASNVYWATAPTSMAPDGTVMVLWGGTGNPVPFASGQTSPGRIAIDPAGNVYWTDPSAGKVMKVPSGSSSVTTLASGQNFPLGIAANTTGVYWTNSGGGGGVTPDGAIMKADSAGTVTTLVPAQSTPNAIAVDGTSVYWTEHTGSRVMKAPIGGGATTTLASGQTYPNGIAVDTTSVYWVSDDGTVMKLTRK
jgi:sugar lactone lactonase YvrE